MGSNEDLIDACRRDDTEKVFQLLEEGADPDTRDQSNLSCLAIACSNGNLEIVRMLILVGAVYDSEIENPLVHAIVNGHLNIVKTLTNIGADIFIQESLSFLTACQYGHLEIVEFLINAGVNLYIDGGMGLLCAITNNQFEVVKYLIDKGVDIHYEQDLPLILATSNLEMTQFLVSKGADINAFNRTNEWTPLFVAIRRNQIEVVKFLLEKGADLNAYNGIAFIEAFRRASFTFQRYEELKRKKIKNLHQYPSEIKSYQIIDLVIKYEVNEEIFPIISDMLLFEWENRNLIIHIVSKSKINICRSVLEREINPSKKRRIK